MVAGGRLETEASVALATEHLWYPFATVKLAVGARELLLATGVP
jgi:hypothetical protein